MRRVLVYECSPEGDLSIQALLGQEGFEIDACDDGVRLLERVMASRPDAIVYVFKSASQEDIGVLQLLRKLAPVTPLVVLANEGSLRVQRMVRELRPIYFAVAPVDPDEIRSAVQSALAGRKQSAAGA